MQGVTTLSTCGIGNSNRGVIPSNGIATGPSADLVVVVYVYSCRAI